MSSEACEATTSEALLLTWLTSESWLKWNAEKSKHSDSQRMKRSVNWSHWSRAIIPSNHSIQSLSSYPLIMRVKYLSKKLWDFKVALCTRQKTHKNKFHKVRFDKKKNIISCAHWNIWKHLLQSLRDECSIIVNSMHCSLVPSQSYSQKRFNPVLPCLRWHAK